jgi:Flp pilus assembly protein TadG
MPGFNNFLSSRRGAAFVEFAVIAPLLLLLFLGTFEVTRVVRTMMKATNAAQTYANLVANLGGLSLATLSDYCTGARTVMTPFDQSPFSAAIAGLSSANGTSWTQMWHDTSSCGSGVSSIAGTTLASNAGVVPKFTGDAVIVVKSQYDYQSPITYVLPASQTLTDTAFARPRANSPIPCTSCTQN